MALRKKIAIFLVVIASLAPTIYLFLQDKRLWAAVWLGLVVFAVLASIVGRDRGLAAYVFTVACLAFLGFSTVTLGGDGHLVQFDSIRAGVGLILLAVIVGSVIFLASDFIFATRGGARWRSFLYLLYWILGMSGTYREVKDGNVKEVKRGKPAVKANVTELITVHPDHAVVLERGGSYTRVVGPGRVYAEPGEVIKKVIRTCGQSVDDKAEDIFTKDEIPVTVHFSIAFRIASDPTRRVELGKPYPFSEEAALKAAYNVGNIEGAMKGVGESLLRDKIAQCSLDEIYDPLNPDTFPLGDIRRQLKEQLENIARNWGLVVSSFKINRVEVPDEVRKQMLERWQGVWTRNEAVEQERTEREAASIRAERKAIEVQATLAEAKAQAEADRIREMEKAQNKEEAFKRCLTLLEQHSGPVDQQTALQLLQMILVGEDPGRLLARLRALQASGFVSQKDVIEAVSGPPKGIAGPSGDTGQLLHPRSAIQHKGTESSSDSDTQDENG